MDFCCVKDYPQELKGPYLDSEWHKLEDTPWINESSHNHSKSLIVVNINKELIWLFLQRFSTIINFKEKVHAWKEGDKATTAFFKIRFYDDVALTNQVFSLSVWQQGNHLRSYKNVENRFVPSAVKLSVV